MKQQINEVFAQSPWCEHLDKIQKYVEILVAYNDRYNLFSRKLTLEQLLKDHLYDSLLGESFVEKNKNVVDIGSGGGFPGLCWAIVRPDLKFCLVEKSYRKATFLAHAVSALNLKERVVIEQKLIQECSLNEYDIFVSRAMCSAQKLLTVLENTNLIGKRILLFKARLENIEREISALDSSVHSKITKLESFCGKKERHLLELYKN